MKFILGLLCAIAVTGCSSSTSQYYEAVQAAAQANAAASQAKFDALSKIAAAGDGQAASAAVMALALTQTPSVTPVRISGIATSRSTTTTACCGTTPRSTASSPLM